MKVALITLRGVPLSNFNLIKIAVDYCGGRKVKGLHLGKCQSLKFEGFHQETPRLAIFSGYPPAQKWRDLSKRPSLFNL